MDIDSEIQRVARLLEKKIEDAGGERARVSDLKKVFQGKEDFRLRDILEVARATGFDAGELFQKAFPSQDRTADGWISSADLDEIMELLEVIERTIDHILPEQLAPLEAQLEEIRRELELRKFLLKLC